MFNKIIVVFPGQGSQIVGMGRDLFDNHPVAREVFKEVDDTLNQKLSKISLTTTLKITLEDQVLCILQKD